MDVTTQITTRHPPRGLLRWLARAPIWLYRARLGWLLDNRFLMLTHLGRKSGLPRQVVLEVIHYEKTTDTCFIASGFGEKANWFLNICQNPEVTIDMGGRRFQAIAERLPIAEALNLFKEYARRHPIATKVLAPIFGYPWDGTEAGYQAMARLVPIIALRPVRRRLAYRDSHG